MEELETSLIDTKKCAKQSNSQATLGLSHMLGRYALALIDRNRTVPIKINLSGIG